MAKKKPLKYRVLPHRGHAGKIKSERWNVCLARTREVILGPYHTRTAADIVCAALNAAEQDKVK